MLKTAVGRESLSQKKVIKPSRGARCRADIDSQPSPPTAQDSMDSKDKPSEAKSLGQSGEVTPAHCRHMSSTMWLWNARMSRHCSTKRTYFNSFPSGATPTLWVLTQLPPITLFKQHLAEKFPKKMRNQTISKFITYNPVCLFWLAVQLCVQHVCYGIEMGW